MIISIYNLKGGVGKTSSTINISTIIAQNKKVLVWDLDKQGATSYFFDKKIKNRYINHINISYKIKKSRYKNIDVIPIDLNINEEEIGKILETIKNSYDFILLDLSAGFNEIIKESLINSDLVISPILPNILSLRTYNQIIEQNLNKNIKLFLNAYEANNPIHQKIALSIKKLPSNQYLKTIIPNSKHIENIFLDKTSIIEKPFAIKEIKSYKKLINEFTLSI